MKLFNKEKIEGIAESIKNRMGIGSPEKNATDTYEREKKIVPECISAIEDETPVKQYNIAVLRNLLKFERAEGRLQITNKRVVFRAAGRSIGGRSTLQHEFAINNIAGIEANNNYKFSVLYLVFAVIIIGVTSFIINWPSSFSGIMSPFSSRSERISAIMHPKYIQKLYTQERAAVTQAAETEEIATKAVDILKKAQDKENQAIKYINQYGENRRIDIGYYNYVWINTTEYKEQCTAEREKAEAEEQQAAAALEAAIVNVKTTNDKRVFGENIWKVLMTVIGLILGIGGLIPFFMLNKKFGLKLIILNFSIFGFALSLAASGIRIFSWLYVLSILTSIVCIFFFCFRPNLVISIKNNTGSGKGPVDIRCNESLNKLTELLSFAVVLLPLAFFGSLGITGSLSDDSIIGPIVSAIIPIILLIIIVLIILRILQNKGSGSGTDSGFAEVIPTAESESAIREIGAIIRDIQNPGVSGVDKWANR